MFVVTPPRQGLVVLRHDEVRLFELVHVHAPQLGAYLLQYAHLVFRREGHRLLGWVRAAGRHVGTQLEVVVPVQPGVVGAMGHCAVPRPQGDVPGTRVRRVVLPRVVRPPGAVLTRKLDRLRSLHFSRLRFEHGGRFVFVAVLFDGLQNGISVSQVL